MYTDIVGSILKIYSVKITKQTEELELKTYLLKNKKSNNLLISNDKLVSITSFYLIY